MIRKSDRIALTVFAFAAYFDLCSVVRGDGIQYRAGFHQARQLPNPPFALFTLLLTHIHDLPNFFEGGHTLAWEDVTQQASLKPTLPSPPIPFTTHQLPFACKL